MAVVFDQNSERGFVYGSLLEFMKCWDNGANSRLVLESCNGYAWMNLTCCLGRPNESHVRKKSKFREEKDNARAAAFKEKMKSKDDDIVQNEIDDSVPDVKNDMNAVDSTEEFVDEEATTEGFVDCSISVKISNQGDYKKYSKEIHEGLNGALNDVVTKYFSDELPEIEVSKIDFSARYTNEWYYHKDRAVSRDHKFRIHYKQKEFSEKVKNLMKAQTNVPVPKGVGTKFVLIGKTLICLEKLALVENDRQD